MNQYAFTKDIITNVKKQANLQNPSSKWYLELDVWIPGLHLGLEFQVYGGGREIITRSNSFRQITMRGRKEREGEERADGEERGTNCCHTRMNITLQQFGTINNHLLRFN